MLQILQLEQKEEESDVMDDESVLSEYTRRRFCR